jgi:RNA polymerase sigma factor (sigma-70 family)
MFSSKTSAALGFLPSIEKEDFMLDADPDRWKELARRIRASDPGSEDEIVRIFYPHVMAVALGRLRDLETAREVTQDTLLGVLLALREDRLREPGKLPSFVSRTAINRVNTAIQKLIERRSSMAIDKNESLINAQQEIIREPPMEEEERRALVRVALRKLKLVDQQILILTLSEGLSPHEIAIKLGIKCENIRNHKSRAIKAIQYEVQKMIQKERFPYK